MFYPSTLISFSCYLKKKHTHTLAYIYIVIVGFTDINMQVVNITAVNFLLIPPTFWNH